MGSTLVLREKPGYKPIPFGKELLKQFLFDPEWKNMNHGSFGTYPLAIRNRLREFQEDTESHPDLFIFYTYPTLLDESRASLAKFLNAPLSTIVFVPNATTGINTVLKNFEWSPDGMDEVISFSTIYGACRKTIIHLTETNTLVKSRTIKLILPLEDFEIIALFKNTIHQSRAAGKRPKVALFDTVASLPGYRMPFEALAATCKDEGIFSLIDGAHGIGHLPLDLGALDPDFFVSNCHKWLFTPRGCAVFYVPERNQHMIRTTLPTSHGFVPRDSASLVYNPLPPSGKSAFVNNFEFVGTMDNAPTLCVPEALKWRQEVCGGEGQIMEYCMNLARDGGIKIAEILGTEILENKSRTMTACCLVNVRLPLKVGTTMKAGENLVKPGYGPEATQWMLKTLRDDHKTSFLIFYFQDAWWARLSGQVYLDIEDFEYAGRALKSICERVGKGQYLPQEGLDVGCVEE